MRVGDEFTGKDGKTYTVKQVRFMGCYFSLYDFGGEKPQFKADYGERVRRPAPKVLDAYGVEIELGDDLYSVEGGLKLHVSHIDRINGKIATDAMFSIDKWADPAMYTHSAPVLDADGKVIPPGLSTVYRVSDGAKKTAYIDRFGDFGIMVAEDRSCAADPADFLVTKPVLAADGKPLREGETVWHVSGGESETVAYTITADASHPDQVVLKGREDDCPMDAKCLTHESPDSWERLEEDVANASCPDVYCTNHHIDASDASYEWAMARDLVRRAKALAERDA